LAQIPLKSASALDVDALVGRELVASC
jgi:hypothetical protein